MLRKEHKVKIQEVTVQVLTERLSERLEKPPRQIRSKTEPLRGFGKGLGPETPPDRIPETLSESGSEDEQTTIRPGTEVRSKSGALRRRSNPQPVRKYRDKVTPIDKLSKRVKGHPKRRTSLKQTEKAIRQTGALKSNRAKVTNDDPLSLGPEKRAAQSYLGGTEKIPTRKLKPPKKPPIAKTFTDDLGNIKKVKPKTTTPKWHKKLKDLKEKSGIPKREKKLKRPIKKQTRKLRLSPLLIDNPKYKTNPKTVTVSFPKPPPKTDGSKEESLSAPYRPKRGKPYTHELLTPT